MKKFLGIMALSVLMLVGCGGNNTADTEEGTPPKEDEKTNQAQTEDQTKDKEVTEDKKEDAKNENVEETGEFSVPEIGDFKIVGTGYNDEVGIDGKDTPLKPVQFGSMNLYINQFHIMDVTPNEEAKALYFNDQDKVRAIVVDLKAENTAEGDVTFDPNQAVMVTDTGEQIEAEMGLMGDVGGDFLGKVTKEGKAWWLLKKLDKDVKSVTMIISPPYGTQDFEDQGEEKRLKFEVLNWEESKKRDQGQ
ncbi:hypothetical protein K7T73_12850 [Bacillus badius]|uniref:hypothetical protein n=1 Tax=Bacillus badius TaxID=1455 RepID=UPI001CC009AF|nr:hypothetical protein [Bacillus badius]UAT29488.1 hypothetical protein K7T73_12850 [Bacillus badius]